MSYEQFLINYNDVLKPEDLMEILDVGRNKIYNYLKDGKIRSIRISGKYRIPKIYLLQFLYPDMQWDKAV